MGNGLFWGPLALAIQHPTGREKRLGLSRCQQPVGKWPLDHISDPRFQCKPTCRRPDVPNNIPGANRDNPAGAKSDGPQLEITTKEINWRNGGFPACHDVSR